MTSYTTHHIVNPICIFNRVFGVLKRAESDYGINPLPPFSRNFLITCSCSFFTIKFVMAALQSLVTYLFFCRLTKKILRS